MIEKITVTDGDIKETIDWLKEMLKSSKGDKKPYIAISALEKAVKDTSTVLIGYGYKYVCSYCYGDVDKTDRYCKTCGRKLILQSNAKSKGDIDVMAKTENSENY